MKWSHLDPKFERNPMPTMCDVYAILSRTCTDSNKLHVGQDYIKEVLGDLGHSDDQEIRRRS